MQNILVKHAVMTLSTLPYGNKFLRRFLTVSISVTYQLSILLESLAILVAMSLTPRHQMHTPDTWSYALLVNPTMCRIPRQSKYSIRLFRRWSIALAHFDTPIAVSISEFIISLPHWYCGYAFVITRSDVQKQFDLWHICISNSIAC